MAFTGAPAVVAAARRWLAGDAGDTERRTEPQAKSREAAPLAWARMLEGGEDGGGEGVFAGDAARAGGDTGLDMTRGKGTRRGLGAAGEHGAASRSAGAKRNAGGDWSMPRGEPRGETSRAAAAGDGGERQGGDVTCGFLSPATPERLRGSAGGDCIGLTPASFNLA